MSVDRVDMQFSCNEASRRRFSPASGDMKAVVRMGRYLLGTPRAMHYFEFQELPARMGCTSTQTWQAAPRVARARAEFAFCMDDIAYAPSRRLNAISL